MSPSQTRYENILFTVEGGVAEICLNRPHRLNAVVEGLYRDILMALDAAVPNASVRVIVFDRGVARLLRRRRSQGAQRRRPDISAAAAIPRAGKCRLRPPLWRRKTRYRCGQRFRNWRRRRNGGVMRLHRHEGHGRDRVSRIGPWHVHRRRRFAFAAAGPSDQAAAVCRRAYGNYGDRSQSRDREIGRLHHRGRPYDNRRVG